MAWLCSIFLLRKRKWWWPWAENLVEDSVLCMQSKEAVFGSKVFSFFLLKNCTCNPTWHWHCIGEVPALQHQVPTILPCLKIFQLFFLFFFNAIFLFLLLLFLWKLWTWWHGKRPSLPTRRKQRLPSNWIFYQINYHYMATHSQLHARCAHFAEA